MATSVKTISLFTLLFLISFLQIQARESDFFSKNMHYNTPKEAEIAETPAPSPQPLDSTTYPPQTQNGFGLVYGHGSDQASPTTKYEYNSNGVPSKFSAAEYTGERNYENKETTTSYDNNEYENKQYGMSGTRFLEKGRYYYDINADQYHNKYESGRGSDNGYGSYRDEDRMNKYNYGGYNSNNDNAYEYHNSMEGYKNTQDDFDDSLP